MKSTRKLALGLTAPAILTVFALGIYPLFFNVYISFTNWSVQNPNYSFVGIENYVTVLSESAFQVALRNTGVYILLIASSHIAIGLVFSQLLLTPRMTRYRIVLLPLIILPGPLSPISVGTIWKWGFDPAFSFLKGTPLNAFLQLNWLGDPNLSLLAVSLVEIWRGYPLATLLLLAGASAIPSEYYAAAKIDGASTWMIFRKVTLPLLRNALILTVIIDSLFTITTFDTLYLLTGGGPLNSSLNLSLWVWEKGFENFEFAAAGAAGIIMLGIFLVISLGIIKFYRV